MGKGYHLLLRKGFTAFSYGKWFTIYYYSTRIRPNCTKNRFLISHLRNNLVTFRFNKQVNNFIVYNHPVGLEETVEYADCISAEGLDPRHEYSMCQ